MSWSFTHRPRPARGRAWSPNTETCSNYAVPIALTPHQLALLNRVGERVLGLPR
jgi:hypothetical protein